MRLQYNSAPVFPEEDEEAHGLWQIAENFRASGRKDLAEEHYKELIRKYPNNPYAEKAKKRIFEM